MLSIPNMERLPDETLIAIAENLSNRELLQFAATNRRYRRVAYTVAVDRYRTLFGTDPPEDATLGLILRPSLMTPMIRSMYKDREYSPGKLRYALGHLNRAIFTPAELQGIAFGPGVLSIEIYLDDFTHPEYPDGPNIRILTLVGPDGMTLAEYLDELEETVRTRFIEPAQLRQSQGLPIDQYVQDFLDGTVYEFGDIRALPGFGYFLDVDADM